MRLRTIASCRSPLFLVGVFAPSLLVPDDFVQRVLTLMCLWAVAATAWNLAYGYAGLLSFGHSAFVGIGAYVFVLTANHWGLSPFLAIPLAALCGAAVAAAIGVPTLRLSGAYLGLATLVMPLLAIVVLDYLGLNELTVPIIRDRPGLSMEFADPRAYSILSFCLLLLVLLGMARLEHSRVGFFLRAIRENPAVAGALGVDVVRWRLAAFCASAAIAAAMGVIWSKAALLVVASHDVFGLSVGIQMISVSLVGGLGNIWGPVIGASLLVPLAEVLTLYVGPRIPSIQILAYGVTLVVVILVAPDGLYWWIQSRRSSRGKDAMPLAAASDPGAIPVARASTGDAPLLVVERVAKAFGGVRAVRGVSFTVRRGELLGIIGPNGAGKTTLFNMVSGLYTVDAGRLIFDGTDITRRATYERCRLGIGRTFQTPQMLARLGVRGNVMVAAFNRTHNTRSARLLADDALRAVALLHRADDSVQSLSTLEGKLLELARALAAGPSLLLADEPMAGLSPGEQASLGVLFQEISGAGITVLIIEHSVRSLLKIVDRIVALDDGEVIADDVGSAVIRHPRVVEAYLGKKWNRGTGSPVALG
ncbi:MAG TPA: branched-chain amino acid ABC transporter [Chloroflexi bacterium]|jgi:branched-chain amino acid transport system permease protein|nr:branched-chain amino acid ABC transporter [Chloroflexota bacterium]HAL26624.1 branched-chain amino acid ABC transporter [Chloroflexota bacterium]